MAKPKAIVLTGYGINCEEETAYAFSLAGAQSTIVHINDVIEQKSMLKRYQIMAVPGGFAYGDDTGAGNAYANKMRNHLWEEVRDFLSHDKLIIGICNGCQIISNLGLVPALKLSYGERQAAWTNNDSARYVNRWVDIEVMTSSPWLKTIDHLMVPIAHGEGKLYVTKDVLRELKKKKLIAVRYVKGDICHWQDLPLNPTGTLEDIAGITDETGKVLAIMPHPERALFFTQLPHWTYLREKYKKEGKRIPTEGPGVQIFKNAVKYFC